MIGAAGEAYRFVDLSSAPQDAELLTRFYETLYVAEFPDPDEREGLANMLGYLRDDGAHGNAYIVTLAYDGASLAGGAVCDYFVRSNCGAIEFLTVAPQVRGRSLGAALARHVERRMGDAAAARGNSLALVMAEMNDPFKRTSTPDNLDPFGRLRFWDRLGYRRMAFPYVQPALSPEQSAVTNLLLAAKPVDTAFERGVESARVVTFLRDYLIYAMRFDDPESSPEFVAMQAYLRSPETIPLEPFDAYTGDDPRRPLFVHAVESPGDPDFGAAMAVYHRAFPDPALAVGEAAFAAAMRMSGGGVRYHLWALRADADGSVCGVASFFALPSAGFGGYAAFEPPLLHAGRLPVLVARNERTLIGDGESTQGWYAECAGDAAAARLAACGFREIALSYRQPPDGPPLRLLYKEFGAVFGPPRLTKAAFRTALGDIARVVYGIDRPGDAPAPADMLRAVDALPGETIPFRSPRPPAPCP